MKTVTHLGKTLKVAQEYNILPKSSLDNIRKEWYALPNLSGVKKRDV